MRQRLAARWSYVYSLFISTQNSGWGACYVKYSDIGNQLAFDIIRAMSVHLRLERRYADLVYYLNGSIAEIRKESTRGQAVEIDARRYLDVFDIFLPPFLQPLDESVSCAFLREANLMTNLTALVGLFLMPMVQQQWFCSHEAEVTVNASFSRLSYNHSRE